MKKFQANNAFYIHLTLIYMALIIIIEVLIVENLLTVTSLGFKPGTF